MHKLEWVTTDRIVNVSYSSLPWKACPKQTGIPTSPTIYFPEAVVVKQCAYISRLSATKPMQTTSAPPGHCFIDFSTTRYSGVRMKAFVN